MNKKYHIYESHHDNYFYKLEEYEEPSTCEICGDSDWYIGHYSLQDLLDSIYIEYSDENGNNLEYGSTIFEYCRWAGSYEARKFMEDVFGEV